MHCVACSSPCTFVEAYRPHFGGGDTTLPIGLDEWAHYVRANGFGSRAAAIAAHEDSGAA